MQIGHKEKSYRPTSELTATTYVYMASAVMPMLPTLSNDAISLPFQDIQAFQRALPKSIDREQVLIAIGKILAAQLAFVLEQIKEHNEEATRSVISLIEPYLDTNQELSASLPPKSSRQVTINVTRSRKALPQASLD